MEKNIKRYKCILAYDGANFAGYQVQPGKRTVQLEVEQALNKIHKGESIRIAASGRTDAGVHARGQVIHFDSHLQIPGERWKKALNAMLPEDISILDVSEVDKDFHARFQSVRKEYRYRISLKSERDPFLRHYAYHYPFPLNLDAMKEAARYLMGTHDFSSFCSAKTEVVDKVRTVEEIIFTSTDDELVIQFIGNGFLYNMVRIMTGTLLEVGSGRKAPAEMERILAARDRVQAGKTAPGHGLYLWKVDYAITTNPGVTFS